MPWGRPDVLYFNPAAAGETDCKFPFAEEKLDQVHRELFVNSETLP